MTTAIEPAAPTSSVIPSTWEAAWKLAQRIGNTPFVPGALRGKPEAILACVLYGDEIGLGPMQSLQGIHVIDGRPAASPELMRALVARAGHKVTVEHYDADRVTLTGTRADTGATATVTWTMQDATRAGLGGKGAWKTYPRAMLVARCTSELCRLLFSDVVAGLSYTPEEAATIAGETWAEIPVDPLSGQPPAELDTDTIDAEIVSEPGRPGCVDDIAVLAPEPIRRP